MMEQGSQSTDNFVQVDSDEDDASYCGEKNFAQMKIAMNKSRSHQTTAANSPLDMHH
jgi:hypothetical protein